MLALYVTLQTLVSDRRDAMRDRSEHGATAVEYGLMVALIAVVIIAAVTTLGEGVRDKFEEIADAIG